MSQLRIFFSYSYQDKPFADALVRALRGAGADVWYDEHSLGTGDLPTEISEQVRTRPIFIVVLSKAAFASEWVHEECRWAYAFYRRDRAHRTILPVVAQPIEASDFDTFIFLEGFRRIEGPGYTPYAPAEAIQRTLHVLQPLVTTDDLPAPPAGQSDPTLARLIALGKANFAAGAYDEAFNLFEVGVRVAPHSFSIWFNLGLVQNELGYWEDAQQTWERALQLKPGNAPALSNYGKVFLKVREFKDALFAFEQAVAQDDRIALRWAGKGIALKYLTQYEQALQALDRALELDANYGEAWAAKANVLFLAGRLDESNAAYNRALTFNADAPRPARYLATSWRALCALGREEEA